MYALGYRDSGAVGAGFDVPNHRAADWARHHAGELIAGIDATTRDEVAAILADAQEATDLTVDDVAARMSDLFAGYAGWRADMIAHTEVALSAAGGAVSGFRDIGVQYVEISDGDDFDEECQAADGATWTVDDYEANPLQHPNCGRSASALDSADVNPDDVSSPE